MNMLKIGSKSSFDLLGTEYSRRIDELKPIQSANMAMMLAEGGTTSCIKSLKV
jgi:hypothetical protein